MEREKLPPLGARQFKVLIEIYRYVDNYRYPPSIRELSQAVGVASTSTVNHHLFQLAKKGYIEKESGKSRALRVLINPSQAQLDFDPNEVFTTEPQVSEEQ